MRPDRKFWPKRPQASVLNASSSMTAGSVNERLTVQVWVTGT